MKKIIIIIFVLSAVFACQMAEVELKPINNKVVTECLIKDITTIGNKVDKQNPLHNTYQFLYNKDGNPIQIIGYGNIIEMEYEKKRLKKVTKIDTKYNRFSMIQSLDIYYKTYEINSDFSIMYVHNFVRIPGNISKDASAFKEIDTKKIYFIRDTFNLNELRISKIQNVDVKDISVNIGLPLKFFYYAYWKYELCPRCDGIPEIFTEEIKHNMDNNYSRSVHKFQGNPTLEFWGNVKNPYSANIWLSLVARYSEDLAVSSAGNGAELYKGEDEGSWSRYMENENLDYYSNYETNAQGYPCKQTNRQPNFQPYPLEIRYSYCNCDCNY